MRFLLAAAALILAVSCSSPTATASPTPSASPPPSAAPFTVSDIVLAHDEPVLEGADLEPGDHYGATLPAAYFVADGVQHLYVVGFGDARGDQQVFHATSADGLAWAVDEADPFAELGLDLSPPGPIPGAVLEIGDEWVMYLWGAPSPLQEGSRIWRAVAAGPGGPWVADQEPVVPLGDRGEVDDRGLDFPSVVATQDGYLMLYGANGGDLPHAGRVLAARSTDGVTWEKLGRVIEPQDCGGSSDDYITIPRLFATGDGYVVVTILGNDIVVLTSANGTDWTCVGDGPIFRAGEVSGSDRVHSFAAAFDGTRVSVIIEALFTDAQGGVYSDLWLASVVP